VTVDIPPTKGLVALMATLAGPQPATGFLELRHRRSDRTGFTVVGAYPAGQENYDLLRGDDPAEVKAARARIAALGPPPDDPVGGEGVARWR
jgi:uncharacterized protein YjlB